MGNVLLSAENITKVYSNRRGKNTVLDGLSLQIEEGKFYTVEGESGSGKSTLISILAGLQKPDGGRVIYRKDKDEQIISELDDDSLSELRRHDIAYVPQNQDILPTLNVRDNIRLVDCFDDRTDKKSEINNDSRLALILEQLGISELENEYPSELSGGELRRVCIARTLYAAPKIVLADEPTNDLDKDNRDKLRNIFLEIADKGVGVVVVTHDPELAEYADERISL